MKYKLPTVIEQYTSSDGKIHFFNWKTALPSTMKWPDTTICIWRIRYKPKRIINENY